MGAPSPAIVLTPALCVRSSGPMLLVDATPLSLWIYAKPDKGTPVKADRERPSRRLLTEFYGSQEKSQEEVGVHVLALASQLVSLQLDHYQLLFLLRLAESLSEMGAFLSSDSVNILHPMVPPGMVIGAVLPQLDMSVILPGGGGGGTSEESFSGGGTSASDNSSDVGTKDPVEDQVVNAVSKEGLPQSPVKSASYTLEPVNDHSDPLSLLNERASEPQSSHVQTPPSLQDLRSQLDTALAEVRVLRARLGEGENKIQEGDIRNKELSTQLDHVRKQMDGLMEEKKSLLDTLRYLQEELLKSGKK